MHIRLGDPSLLGDLREFLVRAECEVEQVGPAVLRVEVPRSPSSDQTRREVELYVATWRAGHPGSELELSDD